MKTQIIQVDAYDDVVSIRDKLTWSKAGRVLLVIPRKRPPRLARLDLVLLQRSAAQVGGQLGLVTIDPDLTIAAGEAGVPAFPSVPAAQRAAWRTGFSNLSRFQLQQSGPRLSQQILKEKPSPQASEPAWLRWPAFIAGLLAMLALGVFFLPSASIEISPSTMQQELDIPVRASLDVPGVLPSGAIPAVAVETTVENQMSAETSATQAIPDTAATGMVELTNLTDQAVDVPSGSVFRTLGNPAVQFETTTEVTLDAQIGASADVPVQAVQAGSQGNVDAGQIRGVEGDIGLLISVDNAQPMAGGSDRQARAASEQDYTRLHDTVITALSEQALQALQEQLPAGQVLLPASLAIKQVDQDVRDPQVGQPADQINLQLQVTFQALAIQSSDLAQLATTSLDANLPAGYNPGAAAVQYKNIDSPRVDADGSVVWQIHASREIVSAVNGAEVADWIHGQTPLQARQYLSGHLSLRAAPVIRLQPDWWFMLPALPFRIEVNIL